MSPFTFRDCFRPFLLSLGFLPALVLFFPGLASTIGTPSLMAPWKVPSTLLTSFLAPFAGFLPAAISSLDAFCAGAFFFIPALPPDLVFTSKSISSSDELCPLSVSVSEEFGAGFLFLACVGLCLDCVDLDFSFIYCDCGLPANARACTAWCVFFLAAAASFEVALPAVCLLPIGGGLFFLACFFFAASSNELPLS